MLRRETPIYHQLARHFEDLIFSGRLAPGARLPTTTELAGEFQVNAETVQSALSQLSRRGLVERRRGAGTFVRPGVAGRCVAIVFGEANLARLDRQFFNLLFDRLSKRLPRAGWDYRPYICGEAAEADRAFHDLQRHVSDGSVRAVIEFCANRLVTDWIEQECPLPAAQDWLVMDEADLLRQALTHLLRHGRRDIVVMGNLSGMKADRAAIQRLAECIVAESGFAPARVRVVVTDEGEATGQAETLRLLQAEPRPDAIASLSDGLTRGIIYGILQQGLRIGGDIALITHGNTGIDIFCHVPLTRLEFDPDIFAGMAIDSIQALIAGTPREAQPPRARLIPGRSCGEAG